jgi:hypothetical protein
MASCLGAPTSFEGPVRGASRIERHKTSLEVSHCGTSTRGKGKSIRRRARSSRLSGPLTTQNRNALDEAQIRALIDDGAKAVRAKDVNGATSSLAPDILSFDVANPLQYVGSDSARKRAEE